jgi:hypothetical protein
MPGCKKYYVYPDGTYLSEPLGGLSPLAELEVCDKKLRVSQPGKEPVEIDLSACDSLLDKMVTERNEEKVIDFNRFRDTLEDGDAFKQCGLDRFLLATYLTVGKHRVSGKTLLDELLGGDEKK